AAARLDRVWQCQVTLPGRMEQIVPTGRLLEVFQVFCKAIRIQDKAKDAEVPACPEALRVLVAWGHVGRIGRRVRQQQSIDAKRDIKFGEPKNKSLPLGKIFFREKALLQSTRRSQRQ